MAAKDARASSTPLIERRSIDYIPEAERHGRLLSQFTLWMGANLQITAIVTGALAVVLGGDVFWSLIGLLVGQLLGGGVMALHAAQGPRLGLPQMISSRVQFGVYGAAIPIVLVCLMYLGFTATGTVLSGQALGQLFGVSDSVGILIFASVIVLVTVLGYRVIHFIGRWLAPVDCRHRRVGWFFHVCRVSADHHRDPGCRHGADGGRRRAARPAASAAVCLQG